MSAAAAPGVILRDAADSDVAAIAAIYAHHVRFGLGSFEEEAPSPEEIVQRRAAVVALGLPFIVAAIGDRVAGYAYANPYRLRSAYRYTLEDSIYIATDCARRGIGRALLARLIDICAAQNYRQLVAVIGDSANTASIKLHEGLGFRHIGVLPAIGFKHGRWVDSVLMQRPLGQGAMAMPAPRVESA